MSTKWVDRAGNPVEGEAQQDRLLQRLYGSSWGRLVVGIMIRPWLSRLAGWFLDSRLSALMIPSFIKKNHIDLSLYLKEQYPSFNAFFTRRIRPELRPIDRAENHLIAPCDSKVSVYPITKDARFTVKNTEYSLSSLLRSEELAQKYEGGTFFLFRLTLGDYHRYAYADDGVKGENIHIQGLYHTVNPVANDHYPIYKENTREYTVLQSPRFGDILAMEVGATLVGRIVNNHSAGPVRRGEEKGRFEFGGSTVILCLQKDRVIPDEDLLRNTRAGLETVVPMGQRIGLAP